MQKPTFYWHDYETFGIDPKRDRPAQFAGLRTDLDFNIIGKPLVIYCKPANDMLPHPEACLITGITPQVAQAKGVNEAEFIRLIHNELTTPNTCALGYNSLRFDDEVTRFTLYRNFYDAYAREWQNGNSRWDIIDMARACYALRPEGIHWPMREDGKPSFKLEDITRINKIEHTGAHDALVDVKATIELAKLIKEKQPKLYDYFFQNRDKRKLAQLLNPQDPKPLLHTSRMFPSKFGCTSIIMPLAMHPTNKNSVICYDLRYDPQDLIKLTAEQISKRLYVRAEDLHESDERIHLKEVHLNKSPVLAPLNTLNDETAKRIQLDIKLCLKHSAVLQAAPALGNKLLKVYGNTHTENHDDPDTALYSGGFFTNDDRNRMDTVRNTTPSELASLKIAFQDARLPEMLFRYRARNFPETLNESEQERWEEFRIERLTLPDNGNLTMDEFEEKLHVLGNNPDLTPKQQKILQDLSDYAQNLMQ